MSIPITVTILGSRGSLPVSGAKYTRYGGATCCVMVCADNQTLLLDGGTGLLNLPAISWENQTLSLLVSHPHLDHLLGIPLCSPALTKGCQLDLYGAVRKNLSLRNQLCMMMAPPLWPVGPEQLPATFRFYDLTPHMQLGAVTVDSMEGIHPGGVTVYRLIADGKTIVFLTDCTITEQNRNDLLNFCQNCDLLLCDGQYSDAEWPTRGTFGHNTWNQMAAFGRDCGAKQIRIFHHDPTHTDEILDMARDEVQTICTHCDLAYDGEELTL